MADGNTPGAANPKNPNNPIVFFDFTLGGKFARSQAILVVFKYHYLHVRYLHAVSLEP